MTEAAQLDAILHGAAFAPITDRAFLRVTGADATRWLNGMVTNNIAALAPGEGNYNFLLNAQGRIQGDCTIYREPGDGPATFLLETGNWQLETVHKTLDHFIIMDDVELTREITLVHDKAAMPVGIVLLGEKAPDALAAAMMTTNEFPLTETLKLAMITPATQNGKHPSWILTPPISSVPYFEIWSADAKDLSDISAWLGQKGATSVSVETLEAFRIYSGTPRYGTDIRDKDLPQETGQTHALHFSKGCYLGQEIVERIRSRGQVHRQFTQFTLTGSLPELPATLEANGKPAGELTSAAQIGDTIYALGYARREALYSHQPLTYPGGTASPTKNQQPTTENQHG
jgi:folate-binding protein YgfZ